VGSQRPESTLSPRPSRTPHITTADVGIDVESKEEISKKNSSKMGLHVHPSGGIEFWGVLVLPVVLCFFALNLNLYRKFSEQEINFQDTFFRLCGLLLVACAIYQVLLFFFARMLISSFPEHYARLSFSCATGLMHLIHAVVYGFILSDFLLENWRPLLVSLFIQDMFFVDYFSSSLAPRFKFFIRTHHIMSLINAFIIFGTASTTRPYIISENFARWIMLWNCFSGLSALKYILQTGMGAHSNKSRRFWLNLVFFILLRVSRWSTVLHVVVRRALKDPKFPENWAVASLVFGAHVCLELLDGYFEVLSLLADKKHVAKFFHPKADENIAPGGL